MNDQIQNSKSELIINCKVAPPKDKRLSHLLIFYE